MQFKSAQYCLQVNFFELALTSDLSLNTAQFLEIDLCKLLEDAEADGTPRDWAPVEVASEDLTLFSDEADVFGSVRGYLGDKVAVFLLGGVLADLSDLDARFYVPIY